MFCLESFRKIIFYADTCKKRQNGNVLNKVLINLYKLITAIKEKSKMCLFVNIQNIFLSNYIVTS